MMERHSAWPSHDFGLMPAERAAVWILRRSLHGPYAACSEQAGRMTLASDLPAILAAFRAAHEAMRRTQGEGLRLAEPCAALLTRHERRLLRAATAAQEMDEGVIDNHLFPLAPDRQARSVLAEAVELLAAGLGTAGYWLAHSFTDYGVPASALMVAKLHGADPRAVAVAWPCR